MKREREREREREVILERGKNKKNEEKKKVTVLQTVWQKGLKWSLFKFCGLYWY